MLSLTYTGEFHFAKSLFATFLTFCKALQGMARHDNIATNKL